MIIGLAIRVVLEFLRRRGVPVLDLSRLRRRQPVFGVTNRAAEGLAERANAYLDQRKGTPSACGSELEHLPIPSTEDRMHVPCVR